MTSTDGYAAVGNIRKRKGRVDERNGLWLLKNSFSPKTAKIWGIQNA
jgi:hypothetical protein